MKQFSKEIKYLSQCDGVMKAIIDNYDNLQFSTQSNAYQILLESIIHQVISMKAAKTVLGKFRKLFNFESFPHPKDVRNISDEQLNSCGIGKQKIGYIRDLSSKFIDKTIQEKLLSEMTNDEVVKYLIQVKGIGKWTAEMFLIFSLGRLDVFPIDDLGIQNAIRKHYHTKTIIEMKAIAEKWKPYQTVATLYLWKSISE
jgi:DNA-3-methyladenine glycosylase II